MVKQTAAAQRRADTEARKAAKATAVVPGPAKQGENHDMNSLAGVAAAAPGEEVEVEVKATAGSGIGSKAKPVKSHAGRKRAAEADDGEATTSSRATTRNTRSKQGIVNAEMLLGLVEYSVSMM